MATKTLKDGTLEVSSPDGLTSVYLTPEDVQLLSDNGLTMLQQDCNSVATVLQQDCNKIATAQQQRCNSDSQYCNSLAKAQTEAARAENDRRPAVTPSTVVSKNKDLARLLIDDKFMLAVCGRRELKHFFSVPKELVQAVNVKLETNYSMEAVSKVYQSVKYQQRFSPTSVKMIVAFFMIVIIWLCIKLPGCGNKPTDTADGRKAVEQTVADRSTKPTPQRTKDVLAAVSAWETKNRWKFTDYRDTIIVHNFHGEVNSADFDAFCAEQRRQMEDAMKK